MEKRGPRRSALVQGLTSSSFPFFCPQFFCLIFLVLNFSSTLPLVWSIAVSFDDQIIRRPHGLIGAGGADFHLHCRELVEKIRRAPRIDEFAFFIDAQSGIRRDELDVFGIIAIEGFGDFRIGAHGIAAEP